MASKQVQLQLGLATL